MEDEALTGGNMGNVRRAGDKVTRPAGPWTPAVHRLLHHLAAAEVGDVPAPVAVSADGTRETLTFVEGDVPAYPMPAWVWSEQALDSSARLLRRLHDATVEAVREGPWRSPTREPAEVICHHDFAPYNLVFHDGAAVGAIDWDFAAPGPRVWDLAYLAYRIVPLTTEDVGDGFGPRDREARLQRLVDAYGAETSVAEVLAVAADRLAALATFSDDQAIAQGRPELANHAALYRRDAATLQGGAMPRALGVPANGPLPRPRRR
ncbi:phosphotransferase [Demequina sp. NBRC 110057]|uniref:phosphotransferase n=1 Tax=Demequina sp. NBRC 110057 TaxID=1570346 RepID=UPI0009FE2E30|nr:phosphotransferase [Demequina sp. NBRC 110057]